MSNTNIATKILKKFPNILQTVKQNISKSKDINLKKTTKSSPMSIYYKMGDQFIVSKSKNNNRKLSDRVKKIADELKISEDIPDQYKDMNLDPGIYTHGDVSLQTEDSEGDTVVISDEVLAELTGASNKVFNAHKHNDMASGVIKHVGKDGTTSTMLERMNEFHPEFENSVGSVHNKSVDSYSIDGKAIPSIGSDGGIVRTMTKLNEVSRLSFPAHPDAKIKGMFLVKTAKGGFQTRKEVFNMENELKEALVGIQKTLDDHSGVLSDQGKKIETFQEFQKGLEDAAIKKDGEADADADADTGDSDADKDKDSDKDKSDDDKSDDDAEKDSDKDADKDKDDKPKSEEEINKMITDKANEIVDKRLSKMLEPKKGVRKSEVIQKAKSESTDNFTNFLGDSSKLKLNSKGAE